MASTVVIHLCSSPSLFDDSPKGLRSESESGNGGMTLSVNMHPSMQKAGIPLIALITDYCGLRSSTNYR